MQSVKNWIVKSRKGSLFGFDFFFVFLVIPKKFKIQKVFTIKSDIFVILEKSFFGFFEIVFNDIIFSIIKFKSDRGASTTTRPRHSDLVIT